MREVNDRIYETLVGTAAENGDFLCECGEEDCSETIQISLAEYLELRTSTDPTILRSAAHAAEQQDRFANTPY
jgi:hypothetical protein